MTCNHLPPRCREVAVVATTTSNTDGSSDSLINVFCSCCGARLTSYPVHIPPPLDYEEVEENDEYE